MVEGRTLLVLLLLGRCQHSATVPQPAKKGVVSAKRAVRSPPMQQHWCSKAGLACVQRWAQLGFQELVWRLRSLAVDLKLGSRKLKSKTPKLKFKM